MPDNRVVYLGKDEAIKANQLVGFTPSDMEKIRTALYAAGESYLAHKVEYASDWPLGDGPPRPGRKPADDEARRELAERFANFDQIREAAIEELAETLDVEGRVDVEVAMRCADPETHGPHVWQVTPTESGQCPGFKRTGSES